MYSSESTFYGTCVTSGATTSCTLITMQPFKAHFKTLLIKHKQTIMTIYIKYKINKPEQYKLYRDICVQPNNTNTL